MLYTLSSTLLEALTPMPTSPPCFLLFASEPWQGQFSAWNVLLCLAKTHCVSKTHPAHFLSEELPELRLPLGKEVAVSLDDSYFSLSCHHSSLRWVGGSPGSVLSV